MILFISVIAISEETSAPKFDKSVFASQVGLTFMGAITSNDNKKFKNNVVLLKIKSSDQVKAFRVGFELEIEEKTHIITSIDQNFIIVNETSKSSSNLRILKDGFVGETKTISTTSKPIEPGPISIASDRYSEEGFERDKGEIRISQEYRDNLIKKDLGKILMQASAEPVMKSDGSIEGFILDQIEPASIFEKSGLQNGDIVTSINGIPLNNVTAAIKLLQSLKDATKVEFEYKRGGQPVAVSIQVN